MNDPRAEITEETVMVFKVNGKTYNYRDEAEKEQARYLALPTWQAFADEHFHDLMPLLSGPDVLAELGWEACAEPMCCGQLLNTWSFMGSCAAAKCDVCGKEARDLLAPDIRGGAAHFIDTKHFRILECDPVWVIISRGKAQEVPA